MTITELLDRAKLEIKSGETALHAAAEDIAAAQEQGATQRQIAEAVGKSAGWVNRLLKWRESGYQDETAFGPQSKASRQRAERVHSTEQKKQKPATSSAQAEAAAARARAETAKAEAARAKAEAQKAKADAAKAKADARTARAKVKAKQHSFFSFRGNTRTRELDNGTRQLLVKSLGMLGSDHAGERANAAVMVEKQRAKLGMTGDELIIPADEAQARAA